MSADGHTTVTIRDIFADLEVDHPHLKENLLAAMGTIQPSRPVDPRYLDLDNAAAQEPELFSILSN